MMRSINALKALLTAQILLDFIKNEGFNDHEEVGQKEFDMAQSMLADAVSFSNVSVAKYALEKVIKNCNLFAQQDVELVAEFLNDEAELEDKE